jgi:hypothetical protein
VRGGESADVVKEGEGFQFSYTEVLNRYLGSTWSGCCMFSISDCKSLLVSIICRLPLLCSAGGRIGLVGE